MTVIGRSVTRLEDGPLVTGRGRFAGDIAFPHVLHMRVVRSSHAHARITAIDTTTALALPGVVAGSIFTFSLTLGDFITPLLVGGANSNFIGNIIYSNLGTAGNLPFAAALALVPIVIMIVYLLGARALGAFESL